MYVCMYKPEVVKKLHVIRVSQLNFELCDQVLDIGIAENST